MAKFKRFDDGNSKKGKERRRDDYDDSYANRKHRQDKHNPELTKRRQNNRNYLHYDESEDI